MNPQHFRIHTRHVLGGFFHSRYVFRHGQRVRTEGGGAEKIGEPGRGLRVLATLETHLTKVA